MSNETTNPASCQTAVSGSAFSIHDLKCGNILNYDTAEGEILPIVIDWQNLKWLTEDPKGFNLVHSPIPLTEEWLLKFGFSDKDYKKGYIGKDFKSGRMILDFVLSKPFSKGEWNNTYTFDFEGHRLSKMEFVHELQNFYYLSYWRDAVFKLTANVSGLCVRAELETQKLNYR